MDTYEKKYKEATKRAKSKVKNDKDHVLYEDDIIDIFPELAESEDKKMVKFIKNQLFNIKKTITENYELDAKLTKAIDWLERQGKQETDEWKEGNVVRHGNILALVIKGRRVMKSNGELFTVQYPNEWVKAAPNEIERFLNELEKKGEKKPNPCDGCINRKGCINCENGELREVEQKPAKNKGMNLKEEEMMANVIEGKVLVNGMGNPILHLWDKGRELIDKKVKIIIINED